MGARQTGKTTLLHQVIDDNPNVLWLNADDDDVREMFSNISADRLKAIMGNKKILVIDEAQRIADVGLRLKIITDQMPEVQLFVTGSSSFDLANKINEPLTGRKWEYHLYPLSFGEMVGHHGLLTEKRLLSHRLVYGYYPDVVTHQGDEEEVLRLLTDSYLYKDALSIEGIHKPDKIVRLLKAVAFQVGSEVSYNELAQLCGLDSKTVDKYITILEESYIIFRLGSFSRNLRNELKSSKKIYFYDNGIRNAVIGNLSIVEQRNDVGQLFENFVISERIKRNHYKRYYASQYFWRTTAKQEIDYLEEDNGKLSAYEIKYNEHRKASLPLTFRKSYPDADFTIINRDNYDEFLLQ